MSTELYNNTKNVSSNIINGCYDFRLNAVLNEQSIEQNSSNITITLYLKSASYAINDGGYIWGGYSTSSKIYYSTNGTNWVLANTANKTEWQPYNDTEKTYQTINIDVPHNSDGTLNIYFKEEFTTGGAYSPKSFDITSDIIELPQIKRGSIIDIYPRFISSESDILHITGTKYSSSFKDYIIISANGKTYSENPVSDNAYNFTYSGNSLLTEFALSENTLHKLNINVTTKDGESIIATKAFTVGLRIGSIPFSVIYKDGKYGVSIGTEASNTEEFNIAYETTIENKFQVNGEVQVNDELNIGSADTEYNLKLNGDEILPKYKQYDFPQIPAGTTPSGQEMPIGRWFDGRTIYRRLYYIGDVGSGATDKSITKISNLDLVINIGGFGSEGTDDGSARESLPYVHAQNQSYSVGLFYRPNVGIGFRGGTSVNLKNVYVWIDYVKSES